MRSAVRKDGADGLTVLEHVPRVARARKWAVVFYNDDYTTKWFVVSVLQQFFQMTEEGHAHHAVFLFVFFRAARGGLVAASEHAAQFV